MVCRKCRDDILNNIEELEEGKEIIDKSIVENITCPGCGEGESCPCVLHSISVTKELEEKKLRSYPKDLTVFKRKDFSKFKRDLFGG